MVTARPIIDFVAGTGPCCIYPLLGCKLNGWKFMATEIQSDSYRCALENVTRNGLKDIITVLHVQDPNLLLEGVVNTHPCHDTVYDFCMCNPPFYSDENDFRGEWSRTGHRPVPHTRNTGNEVDTVTEGGEIEFIKRIVEDSLRLKTKIKWYTSLIGKKSSLKVITSLLKAKKIPVIASTEMVQGRTHRWGIAWSFDVTLDSFKTTEKRSQPYNIDLRAFDDDEEKANEWLVGLLNTLQIEYKRIDEEMCWYCKTSNNTWSKQRKRKRLIERIEKAREEGKKTDEMMEELRSMDTECLIEFKCWIEREELSREKKMKMSTSEISNDDGLLCCKFEWIDGTSSKDELHQIIQYIRNQLT
jgi:methyltransferase